MATFFSEHFQLAPKVLDDFGVVNISLVADLPLFVDPFLLFNSDKAEYRALHDEIVRYLKFLRDKAKSGIMHASLLKAWYCFPEVRQTWLGFSEDGNAGHGLGMDFAKALHRNLNTLFVDFGKERITKGTHLEKVCLVKDGVGRDNVSDFTSNLIKKHLCELTQSFARKHLSAKQRRVRPVDNVEFNYMTERWLPRSYELPWTGDDYVILCPKDMLTKDDTWINRSDLTEEFEKIPDAIPDDVLRAQINNYFAKALTNDADEEPTKEERREAAMKTIAKYPELLDWYIKYKEEQGDKAISVAKLRLQIVEHFLVLGAQSLVRKLRRTAFYKEKGSSYEEAHRRIAFFKREVENSGWRSFYTKGKVFQREKDVQRLFKFVWSDTSYALSPEVDHGKGPADFEVSKGASDKTIIEVKLAKNTSLKQNLKNQAELYQAASGAGHAIKIIVYFSAGEFQRVQAILKELKLTGHRDVVLIDARNDNKPSASKAR